MQQNNNSKSTVYNKEEISLPDEALNNQQAENTNTLPHKDDIEENNLVGEEAGQVIGVPPKKGSSGNEEKDFTD